MVYGQTATLQPNEDDENEGGDEYIHSKECANARGKKLLEK